MKRLFLLVTLLLVLIVPCALAADTVEWIQVPKSDPTYQKDLAWYYSPTHTKISPQGRLETWLKSEYIGKEEVPTLSSGDYSIWEVYVNPTFDKEMTTKKTEYKFDGTVKNTIMRSSWTTLRPGSNFENCLQAAYKYANDHK